jgi:hypothetical protein
MLARRVTSFVSFALFLANHASADASSQDKAVASRLFDDAASLMASDRAEEACAKYAESERLDPQLGTLLHLGECYAKTGKTASAWGSFRDAAEIANKKSDPREAKIRERVAALEKNLSNVVISVAEPEPAGLEVRQDDNVVGRAIWGSPIPVDPGTHNVTATAPGRKPWTGVVRVAADGATTHVNVPTLEAAPVTDAATPIPQAGPMTAIPTSAAADGAETRPSSSSAGSTQRILGWTAVGAGAVGLGLGLVFELQKAGKLSDRDAICPTGDCGNLPPAQLADDKARIAQLTSDAQTDSTIAVVGFVAGGVLAAGGLVLVFTAPNGESATAFAPLLGPGIQGAMVRHVW